MCCRERLESGESNGRSSRAPAHGLQGGKVAAAAVALRIEEEGLGGALLRDGWNGSRRGGKERSRRQEVPVEELRVAAEGTVVVEALSD